MKRDRKISSWISLLIGLLVVILLNLSGQFLFWRFDLTEDKRFSIAEGTSTMLEEMDDIIFVRIYLAGDLPYDYERLSNATKELMDEFRAINENVNYEFVDPSAAETEQERNKNYRKLAQEGLQYTTIKESADDQIPDKLIYPQALVFYKERKAVVQLLNGITVAPEPILIHQSIQQLEYQFASALENLRKERKARIGFINTGSEFSEDEVAEISYVLRRQFEVEPRVLDHNPFALDNLDAVVVAGPDSAYSDQAKFILDQFILKGGKAMFFLDMVQVSSDSLQANGLTVSVPKTLNIEDMLFKYGARVNTNLVMDMNGFSIPVMVGKTGNQPRYELFPWYYAPRAVPGSKHPIVKNLDFVKTDFVNSIDTIGRKGIRKTVLLTTSPYSKAQYAPSRVSLNILRHKPDQRTFNQGPQPLAVLLEGSFESVFSNWKPGQLLESTEIGFVAKNDTAAVIVVSDADIIRNDPQWKNTGRGGLGYDRTSGRTFGNRDFIVNCMNYLLGESSVLDLRGKEIKLRLLDQQKYATKKVNWKAFNMAGPLALVLLLGFTQFYIRRRRYGERKRDEKE